MQKVLLITYYWPPAGGAGVQRWLKFVKYLSSMGFDIHVYTASNPEVPAQDESLLEEVPSQLKVVKKPIWEPFEVYRRFTGKKDKSSNAFLSEESRGKHSLAEYLALWVRANLFLPDAKRFWITPSLRFLRKYIRTHQIPLIISTGPPHTVHKIAYHLHRKEDVRWLADFRDPWTQIDYFHELPMLSVVKKWHQRWERKIVQTADKVVVVSPQMETYFAKLLPASTHKLSLITNGYDSTITQAAVLDNAFSIVHSGSINADRTHASFFQGLKAALEAEPTLKKHLQLVWIGKLSYEARQLLKMYELEPYAVFPGYVPYAQLASRLATARILYLPINNTPDAKGIVTGKFFEYLPAQRPVLAQGPLDGNLATLIERTQSGVIFDFEDKESVTEWILNRYKLYINHNDAWENHDIEAFSRQVLSQHMAKLLQTL